MHTDVIKININLINHMYDFNDKEVPFISHTMKCSSKELDFYYKVLNPFRADQKTSQFPQHFNGFMVTH